MGASKTGVQPITDYKYNIIQFDPTDLSILQDFEYGEESEYGMSAPEAMGIHESRWLVVGGGIFQSAVQADGPRGSILVFDTLNMSLKSSVKLNWDTADIELNFKAVDLTV